MALEIFKLVGSIMVDSDKANESISKTDQKAEGLGTTLAGGAKKAGQFAAAVVGAATTAGAGMFSLAQQTAGTADEIDKASQRMNISTTAYQEYAYAAGQCGVETSILEQAAKKLEGTDLNFDDAIEQIMSLATEEERSAMAAELFGEKVAYNLSPLLAQSGEDFQALKQNAEDLGIVMSEDAVEAGVKLGDTISDVKQSFTAMAGQLGASLMPAIQSVLDLIIKNIPTIQGIIQNLIPLFVSLAEAILPTLMQLAETLLPIIVDLINQLLPVVTEIMTAVLPIISQLLEALAPIILKLLETLGPLVADVLTAIMPLLEPIMELIGPITDLLVQLLSPLIELLNMILPPLIDVIGAFIKILSDNLKVAIEIIKGVIDTVLLPAFNLIVDVVETVVDKVKSAWDGMAKGIKNFVDSIKTNVKNGFNSLISFVKTPINAIIGIINKFINGVNKIKITVPDWAKKITDIDSIGFSIPTIPLLAKGGTIGDEGSAIVGEAGAELIDLPVGAKVTPLTGGNGGSIEEKFDQMVELLQSLVSTMGAYNPQIVLETGVLVGEIAPNMDRELGKLSAKNARRYV